MLASFVFAFLFTENIVISNVLIYLQSDLLVFKHRPVCIYTVIRKQILVVRTLRMLIWSDIRRIQKYESPRFPAGRISGASLYLAAM
jgi:hypothetical protein